MADDKGKKTPEEENREIALKNLKATNLMNVATAYLVHKGGQYGKAGDLAMQEFKYFPAFDSGLKAYAADGTEYDVMKSSILKSRDGDELYSGNVSEMRIMKECAGIAFDNSLKFLTVNDIMGFVGSKTALDKKYDGKFLGDLLPKVSEEELAKLPEDKQKAIFESQQLYQQIVGSYQAYLSSTKVSEALAESAKTIPKGLEKLLGESDKKKE
jgi:hypothetical protein